MKNLLVGNGINIQFNKVDYSNQQIILRILKNCDRDDFPSHIIVDSPYLLKNYIGQLFLEAQEIICGNYDKYALIPAEKESLVIFKDKYYNQINQLKITDISFEDYFLIHDLVFHKMGKSNPEQFYIREGLRLSYLYSIFNDGKLNKLYKKYSKKFIEYLLHFDNIFTTNYDSNVELATGKDIIHLHGQFDKKSNVYSENSLRNHLSDAPIKETEIDEKYFYLYSNAISSYCGSYKEYYLKQYSRANNCVENMASAYKSDLKIKHEVDNWTQDTNPIISNLGNSIQLKVTNPLLKFLDDYHFDKFQSIKGTLGILGLSPFNDYHIFESINNNSSNLTECIYYFFNKEECSKIENLLSSMHLQKKLKFESVNKFWDNYYEEKSCN